MNRSAAACSGRDSCRRRDRVIVVEAVEVVKKLETESGRYGRPSVVPGEERYDR